MPRELKTIALVIEDFAVPSPAQQLLDRFLIGYPRGTEFHRLAGCRIVGHLPAGANDTELKRRAADFGLVIAESVQQAVADADAVIVAWRGAGGVANDVLLRAVLDHARPGTPCFVHGALATGEKAAHALLTLASSRKISLISGTPLGVTWRLPQIELPSGSELTNGLVIVQGPAPEAEFEGLDCLSAVIEGRTGGESGLRRIRFLEGASVWRAGDEGEWSWRLLAAAISRSDSPQGDPVTDGRTQDLVGLGLVPKLAKAPRAWLLEHRDGLKTAIMVLDGVVADYDFAVEARDGRIYSAQIYRPPAPAEHQFSRLAEVLEEFFRTGQQPWLATRGPFVSGALGAFNQPSAKSGKWMNV